MDLEVDAPVEAAALAVLSVEERDWAARLRQPAHRRQFVVTRAALRRVLGDALDQPPEAVALLADSHGKPRLALGGLHFNLSHSGGVALIAVCADHPVGVDVEQVGRSLDQLDDIARIYFSMSEQAAYVALPPAQRMEAFYRGWTRKEAVAKAVGLGMSLPGPSFDVTLGRRARLLKLGDMQPGPWSLIDLDLRPSYFGAVAAPARALRPILRPIEALAPLGHA